MSLRLCGLTSACSRSPRRRLARAGKLFVLIYILGVAGLSAVNLFFSPIRILPWAELFYGPAITLFCCFLLFAMAVWIDSRWSRREVAAEDKPDFESK